MSLLMIPFPLHTPSALLLSLTSSYSLVKLNPRLSPSLYLLYTCPCGAEENTGRADNHTDRSREYHVGLMLPGSHTAFPQSIHSASLISDVSHCFLLCHLLSLPPGRGRGRLKMTEENFHSRIILTTSAGPTSASLPPPSAFALRPASPLVSGSATSVAGYSSKPRLAPSWMIHFIPFLLGFPINKHIVKNFLKEMCILSESNSSPILSGTHSDLSSTIHFNFSSFPNVGFFFSFFKKLFLIRR